MKRVIFKSDDTRTSFSFDDDDKMVTIVSEGPQGIRSICVPKEHLQLFVGVHEDVIEKHTFAGLL